MFHEFNSSFHFPPVLCHFHSCHFHLVLFVFVMLSSPCFVLYCPWFSFYFYFTTFSWLNGYPLVRNTSEIPLLISIQNTEPPQPGSLVATDSPYWHILSVFHRLHMVPWASCQSHSHPDPLQTRVTGSYRFTSWIVLESTIVSSVDSTLLSNSILQHNGHCISDSLTDAHLYFI